MNIAYSAVEPQIIELVGGCYQINYNIVLPAVTVDGGYVGQLPPVQWQYNYVRVDALEYSPIVEALIDASYSRGAQIGKAALQDGCVEKVQYIAFVDSCKTLAVDVLRGVVIGQEASQEIVDGDDFLSAEDSSESV